MKPLLDLATVTEQLARRSGWCISSNHKVIEKSFVFDTFPAAFSFMTRVAFWAECNDHHPDWRNVYNRVEVRLTTHDSGGLTQNDLDLAQMMDTLIEA
ncbi:4a-hydroxytetrahydrobiopterin dehydratase [Magnetovibrio blakemorei]|uniref:Putative pterin-4-alpha-carbinolamine dehydratase n=1 Tax=Magnetovibrio blakemorei TaxID=28181 RepID=A0A1E5Q3A7_9PROT|nr:4a-hydroxytetrahydrobiopterin dehydratase [Magnetovibrio blakemorei]OEJ64047.1 4a-hydroxytetrahydrobiopterin dehydratase [Magnetovibrio blakemorei]